MYLPILFVRFFIGDECISTTNILDFTKNLKVQRSMTILNFPSGARNISRKNCFQELSNFAKYYSFLSLLKPELWLFKVVETCGFSTIFQNCKELLFWNQCWTYFFNIAICISWWPQLTSQIISWFDMEYPYTGSYR